jgi:signal transduction histidine kinase
MLKRLRRRMLLTIMTIGTVILLLFVLVVVVVPTGWRSGQARAFLERAAEEWDGLSVEDPDRIPVPPPNGAFGFANMIQAQVASDGTLMDWQSDRKDLYDEDYIRVAVKEVLRKDREFGIHNDQYYLVRYRQNDTLVLMLDNAEGFRSSRSMGIVAVVAAIVVWGLLFLLSVVVVRRMTEPVQNAFEQQRRFIADAGHELKTPIAVIGANANVLQSEIGENRWLTYIQNEAGRMETLVRQLMTLAQIDQVDRVIAHEPFNASQAVMRSALPFEMLAFEKNGMVLNTYIQPDIMMTGREDQICQLVGIFVNNAIRYGAENGEIRVLLTRVRKKITLSVYNTGIGVAEEERTKIFDRFYRVDKARSRSGGNYGLGLAIAKAILEEHNAQIAVEGEYGKWVRFVMTFNA